ncbi:MAG: acetolactate synthase, partial [Clostridia bacterium]
LKEAGFTASITEVVAVSIEDSPGGLHKVLKVLADNEIGVDYIYSTIRAKDDRAVIMIKVEDPAKAIEILKANDIRLVDTVELTSN